MKLLQWTFFIDMLGYRDINGGINSEEEAKNFINFMKDNKTIYDLLNGSLAEERYKEADFNPYQYYDFKYAFVSDSLIITLYPKEVESLIDVRLMHFHSANMLFIMAMRIEALIYYCFTKKNIFLRGGVSNKYCYIEENFAVGEGLVEAYLVESKLAKYPRIALHQSIISNAYLMHCLKIINEKMYPGFSLLEQDSDEIFYINSLGYVLSLTDEHIPMVKKEKTNNSPIYKTNVAHAHNYLKHQSDAIINNIKNIESKFTLEKENKCKELNNSVLDKYIWLKEYHNRYARKYKEFNVYLID